MLLCTDPLQLPLASPGHCQNKQRSTLRAPACQDWHTHGCGCLCPCRRYHTNFRKAEFCCSQDINSRDNSTCSSVRDKKDYTCPPMIQMECRDVRDSACNSVRSRCYACALEQSPFLTDTLHNLHPEHKPQRLLPLEGLATSLHTYACEPARNSCNEF